MDSNTQTTEGRPPRIWRVGQSARITYDHRTVLAKVVLASANGVSLAFAFEALLGGYAGYMPVMWSDRHREFRCLILGAPVEVRAASDEDAVRAGPDELGPCSEDA